MSLKFVLGTVGSGKTEYCISEMRKRRAVKNGGLIYLVPEQAAMQSEKRLISGGSGGLMDIQVMSFRRLAYHVFGETGGAGGKILGDCGKFMLLRKALYDLRNELKYYKGTADKMGFIEELSLLISEFGKYSIGAEKLGEVLEKIENIGTGEAFRLKLGDICLILEKYSRYHEEYAVSSDELLDKLADKLGSSSFIRCSEIWIDGFYGFTPQEYKVIGQLAAVCERVTVALCSDPTDSIFVKESGNEVYSELRKTYKKVRELCAVNSISVENPVILEPRAKFAGDITFLLKRLGGIEGGRHPESEHITIYQAKDRYDEINNCANEIIRYVNENHCHYGSIGVILCSPDSYAARIKPIFKRLGIPFFMDEKTNISSHRLMEFIRSALETLINDRAYESMFGMLKTGFSGINIKDIDMLENYVLEYGITGRKWLLEWMYAGDNKEEGFAGAINAVRETVVTMTSPLDDNFNRWGKYEAGCITERVYELLINNGVPEKLDKNAMDFLAAGNNELSLRERQVWPKTVEVFDKLVEILGDTKVTLYEYSKILEAGFSSVKLSSVPASIDNVLVGDFNRSIFPEMKALFVLGLNDGEFPKLSVDNGVLNDFDRGLLEKCFDIELRNSGINKTYEDIYLFGAMLGKAADKLYFSYRSGDAKGRRLKRSILLDDICRFFDGNIAEGSCGGEIALDDIVTERGAYRSLAAELGKLMAGESVPVLSALYGYFSGHEFYRERLCKAVSLVNKKSGNEALSPVIVRNFFGDEIKTSVSKLETYYRCPFSYFAQYMLRAEERKTYSMQSLEVGNYFHCILDGFSKKLIEKGGDGAWREFDRDELASMAESAVDEAFEPDGQSGLFHDEQNLYFKRRLKETALVSIDAVLSQLKSGDFEIRYSEVVFAGDNGEQLSNDTGSVVFDAIKRRLPDGTNLALEGKIDRVDILRLGDRDYVKIMDYKSGKKDFKLLEAYYGLSLQLLIYLRAFIEKYNVRNQKKSDALTTAYPAAALYFMIKNPLLDNVDFEDGAFDQKLLSEFKMKGGMMLDDIDVIKRLDGNLESTGKSNILPVSITKQKPRDLEASKFGKYSRVYRENDLNTALDYSIKMAERAGENLLCGNIAARPYKLAQNNGCRYCQYKSICRFDPVINSADYNRLKKLNDIEIIEKMNTAIDNRI